MIKRIQTLVFFFLLVSCLPSSAQPTIRQFVDAFNSFTQQRLTEKVFLHLDRNFYLAGETAWFKIYLVDGYCHQPVNSSAVVYLEFLDADNNAVFQEKIAVKDGFGNGSFTIPFSFTSGNYILRAYTQWMKNFSSEFYFHQAVTVVNVFRELDANPISEKNKTDIQFFPEGGYLIDGIESKVAFRVVDGNGKGIHVKGTVVSSRGDTVARFVPLKFGIGNFTFTPNIQEHYRVVVQDRKGVITSARLAEIKPEGYSIHVTDTTENRISVKIRTRGQAHASSMIYLIGHTRQVIKVAHADRLRNGTVNIIISKRDLGEGISHVTLFNEMFKPVAERLIFNKPANPPVLRVSTDQDYYSTRSKVELSIHPEGAAQASYNLSLAIFKDDSLQQFSAPDISSYIWLSSDLKGSIESPEYYFSDGVHVDLAMDNLMLTHGWSRFEWEKVNQNAIIKFLPEYRGPLLTGRVLDKNGNPLSGIKTYLGSPGKRIQLYGAISDAQGEVKFEMKDFYGRRKIIIQTTLPDSLVRISLASPFSDHYSSFRIPSLTFSEKHKVNLTSRSIALQVNEAYALAESAENLFKPDTSAFFGKAFEHYNLDDYTRFPVMEEVMREYVKNVRVRKRDNQFFFKVVNTTDNSIFANEPMVLLDGVPILNTDKIMAYDPILVKTLDVVTQPYSAGALVLDGIVSYRTYRGDLSGFQFTPGKFVLDYDALQAGKTFYSPRYETSTERNSRVPNARQLLYWAPDLQTSGSGKVLDFYTSDQPGKYLVIVQGLSSDGRPVFARKSFMVTRSRK